jgi:hypothetical protein
VHLSYAEAGCNCSMSNERAHFWKKKSEDLFLQVHFFERISHTHEEM